MSAKVPINIKISWLAITFHIFLIVLITYVFKQLHIDTPFLVGAITFSLLAMVLRRLIAKDHRKGIALVRQKNFADAIPYFEKSIHFFTQNSWIDKWRAITLLSASGMGYREMGLCNLAFCNSQLGKGEKAIAIYEQTLREYPDNGLAIAGLNMIRSIDKS